MRYAQRLGFFVAILILAVGLVPQTARAASFNPSNIIDDSVFSNSTSMSGAQIDSWLNANFPNSCISSNSGFEAKVPSGYSPTSGFSYGGFTTAGQVIATSAQVYGINPQALLVTLQKEQSLVSGAVNYCNNGDEHKYAAAVGYGCPDGGAVYNWSGVSLYRRNGVEHTTTGSTCVNSSAKAGFSQQIIRAAWLLKFGQQRSLGNTSWAVITGNWNNSDDPQTCYGGPMTPGQRKRCSSDANTVFYDGYVTIDGVSTRMDSGATAALYWYTPHFHGNENFFNLFTAWFGTTYGDTIGPYAYRLYNPARNDHNYTAIENQRAGIKGLGYRDDGIAFKVSPTQEAGMVPIYRLYNGRLTDYWMVPDGMNRYWGIVYGGYRDEGIAFYAYPANAGTSGSICPQGQAVYQMWHGGAGDHFYSTNSVDRYWGLNYGGYIDDRSGSYISPNQGSASFCIPY